MAVISNVKAKIKVHNHIYCRGFMNQELSFLIFNRFAIDVAVDYSIGVCR